MEQKRLDEMYNEGWAIGLIVGIGCTVAVGMAIVVILAAVGS